MTSVEVESSSSVDNKPSAADLLAKRYPWSARFLQEFPWLRYNEETQEASCCHSKCTMYAFHYIPVNHSTWQGNYQSRLMKEHERTNQHQRTWMTKSLSKGQSTLKLSSIDDSMDDEAVWICIQCAWLLATEHIAIHKFGKILESHLSNLGYSPNSYDDDHMAWELIEMLIQYFRKLLRNKVMASPYYGISVDETTDASMMTQLILYIKYLERNGDGDLVVVVKFLDLVTPESGTAESITVSFSIFSTNDRMQYIKS